MTITVHFKGAKKAPAVYRTGLSVVHKPAGILIAYAHFPLKSESEVKKETFDIKDIEWITMHP